MLNVNKKRLPRLRTVFSKTAFEKVLYKTSSCTYLKLLHNFVKKNRLTKVSRQMELIHASTITKDSLCCN